VAWIHRIGRFGLVAGVLGSLAVTAAVMGAPKRSALVAQDPAARLGGRTIVGNAKPNALKGSPRSDHLAGFGGGDVLRGRAGDDNLVGQGGNDRVFGGPGRDTIRGNNGNDTLYGGAGFDNLSDPHGRDVIHTGAGSFYVNVRDSSPNDQVFCEGGSGIVRADRSDRVDPTCRRHGTSIRATAPRPSFLDPHPNITGSGTNDEPYRTSDPPNSPCIPRTTDSNECFYAYDVRYLEGPWANEFAPSYRCPTAEHPYLINKSFDSTHAGVVNGVRAISDENAIDVSITWYVSKTVTTPEGPTRFATGTLTGFPFSSATNWLWGGRHGYQVVLYCTGDLSQAIKTQT
jgi:hypothetical protein